MKFRFLTLSTLAVAWLSSDAQTMDWLCHPGQFTKVSYLGHDLFKVQDNLGKCGIIQANGKTAIEIRYDSITPFVENKALLLDREGKRLFGIINDKGEVIKDLSRAEYYVTKYPNFKEGRLAFKNREGLSGYLNERGDIAIEPAYYLAAPFQDGIAAVQYKSGDYGLINKGGKSAIVSNTEYEFVSSPVNGRVLAITGSSKGGNALRLYRIENASLKKERTLANGMYVWLSDDFTSVECQKGDKYYIDDQWRISGSNTGNSLPQVSDEPLSFQVETSMILGKTNVENGQKITYLGNPIVNNVFPNVSTYDNYAIVHSRDGKVGVLRLNKSAAIDIKAPVSPIALYHNQPSEVFLDVDLKAVNPEKLHWYRNDVGYLTHSSLEQVDGKYRLRLPYFKANSKPDEQICEDVDIAFTYDGLDWMHHKVSLQSLHPNTNRFDVSVSGKSVAGANGICKLNIEIRSLNGPAKGKVSIKGMKSESIDGESISIPVTVNVPNNTTKDFSFSVNIEEDGCPEYSVIVKKRIKGYTPVENEQKEEKPVLE